MKFKSHQLAFVLSSISPLLIPADAAPLQVARIFGDNMVLQQQQANPVWGQSTPGTLVRVELAGVAVETSTGPDGNWRVQLPPLPAGGPHEMTVRGPDSRHFKNVMIGEVWLVSGQSNMDFRLAGATGAPLSYRVLGEAGEELAQEDERPNNCHFAMLAWSDRPHHAQDQLGEAARFMLIHGPNSG